MNILCEDVRRFYDEVSPFTPATAQRVRVTGVWSAKCDLRSTGTGAQELALWQVRSGVNKGKAFEKKQAEAGLEFFWSLYVRVVWASGI